MPLKVFAHLEGTVNPRPGSPLWTQDDHFPQDGRVSTTNWEIGTGLPGCVYPAHERCSIGHI